jgi:hypothetical protein
VAFLQGALTPDDPHAHRRQARLPLGESVGLCEASGEVHRIVGVLVLALADLLTLGLDVKETLALAEAEFERRYRV